MIIFAGFVVYLIWGLVFDFIMKDSVKEFQTGINALKKLTDGKIHLGLSADSAACEAFSKANNIEFFASVWDLDSVTLMAKYTKIGKIPNSKIGV